MPNLAFSFAIKIATAISVVGFYGFNQVSSSREIAKESMIAEDCIPSPPSQNETANAAFYLAAKKADDLDFGEALKLYDIAIQEDPDFFAAYANRGVIYKKLGSYTKALTDYKTAEVVDPVLASKDGCLYDNMANIFKRQGDYTSAIKFHAKAVSISPRNPNIYANKCGTLLDMGDYDLAISDCKKSLEIDSQNYLGLYNYGYTLFLADKEEESIPYLTKAIEIKPTLELYRTRGVAYLLTGKRALACDDIYTAYDGGDEKADKWLQFC